MFGLIPRPILVQERHLTDKIRGDGVELSKRQFFLLALDEIFAGDGQPGKPQKEAGSQENPPAVCLFSPVVRVG